MTKTPPSSTPMSDAPDLCRLGVDELTAAYRAGTLSPVEVAKAALARAEAINPAFNGFSFIDHAGALEAAEASGTRWRVGTPVSPIDGVPTTIKDLVRVKGWSVRYGSLTTDPTPYTEDAPAVGRLRDAGAVFIGLTTSPEFGWKAVTDTALNGITRNPWNPAVTPGGSSGGAAVAAATGAGVLHLGTDGAGSIRIPCAFSGISGIKPTFGRVPAYPLSPFGTIAHLGPMTRRVADTAHMLRAMSGRDVKDWAQGAGALRPLDDVAVPFKGARIGVWSETPCGEVHPEVAANFAATVNAIEALGRSSSRSAYRFLTRSPRSSRRTGSAARPPGSRPCRKANTARSIRTFATSRHAERNIAPRNSSRRRRRAARSASRWTSSLSAMTSSSRPAPPSRRSPPESSCPMARPIATGICGPASPSRSTCRNSRPPSYPRV